MQKFRFCNDVRPGKAESISGNITIAITSCFTRRNPKTSKETTVVDTNSIIEKNTKRPLYKFEFASDCILGVRM